MKSLADLLQIQQLGANIIAGTVISVDEINYSCVVQPDKDNIPQLENVPLRVYNLQDDFGIITIPEENSPCFVAFLESNPALPILLRCQHWQKIIIQSTSQNFKLTLYEDGITELETKNDVTLKIDGDVEGEISGNCVLRVQGNIQLGPLGQHKGAWGDIWLAQFNAHIHPTPNGPSGPPNPPLEDQQVNSQKVKLD